MGPMESFSVSGYHWKHARNLADLTGFASMVAPFSSWMRVPNSFAFLRIGTGLNSRAGIHHNKEPYVQNPI